MSEVDDPLYYDPFWFDVDNLLYRFRDLKFPARDECLDWQPHFMSMRAALHSAQRGETTLDCTLFARVVGALLYDREQYWQKRKFEIVSGMLGTREMLRNMAFVAPYDIPRSQAVDVSSHGQWILQVTPDDPRWIGMTEEGVEAHTFDGWLDKHSSMIPEAVTSDISAEMVYEAALLSDEWCVWQTQASLDIAGLVIGRDLVWHVAYTRPRKRVRTRYHVRREIEIARLELH